MRADEPQAALPMWNLTLAVADLLEGVRAALPEPHRLVIGPSGIGLEFEDSPASVASLLAWYHHFGSAAGLTSEAYAYDPSLWVVAVAIAHLGVPITLYALLSRSESTAA